MVSQCTCETFCLANLEQFCLQIDVCGHRRNEVHLPRQATHAVLMSEAQISAIDNLCRRRDIAEEQLQEMAREQFGVSVQELNPDQAGNFIRMLQQAA